ncbi:MAG: hypothetical protein IJ220_07230 [Clostridia bacterium]|nr:hypothetical protein [Clostridia bacterium]
MKKILLILITIALVYLVVNTVTNGMEIGNLKIPSYSEIQRRNQELDTKIASLDNLIKSDYEKKKNEVASAKADFNVKKQSYDSLAANATDEQLEAAMKNEEYLLDYLWILVGNYANDNNVKFLMNVNDDEEFTIDFDVTGRYISIINFIYDLANDAELKFVIDNIQLEGGSNQNEVTKGKFTVSGVNVVTKVESEEAEG